MHHRLCLIGSLALSAWLMPCAAADLEELTQRCSRCHGEQGYSEHPDVPVIAGFSYQGFIDTLAAFREGERVAIKYETPGSPAIMMNDIARELSEAEVETLARYYSGIPFIPRRQAFDPALAAEGAKVHDKSCEKCHSKGGSDPQDDAAILAGQWTPYLRRQFGNITDGKRTMPRRMMAKFRKLSDTDKEALLNFYASRVD